MLILHSLLTELKQEFAQSKKGEERGPWFIYTLLAIILPFTSSRTSNLLRAIETLFGFTVTKKKYYRFMASPKIPWNRLWIRLWKLIPEPETKGRLIVAGPHPFYIAHKENCDVNGDSCLWDTMAPCRYVERSP